MNDDQSDGNGNIVDIFVLSTDAADSPIEAGYLEKRGYQLTFFSDAQPLLDALRAGKPNLLICDSVTFPEEAYDICHHIKDDFDLWNIPVLVVTGASNLSDLLNVLDSNADNFISQPYDPAYLSSLIEGMLATPVERPTSEQIKTQFKIQHDDRMFVVTADRRRLLEFLLSSFEIGVNRSITISRIAAENETLSTSLGNAEGQIRDQGHSIESLSGTLQERDATISTLTADGAEKDRLIQKNETEIRQLNDDLASLKDQSVADREEIQRLTREAEEAADRAAKESGALSQQVSCLSERLAAASAELKETEASLSRETGQRKETETRIIGITTEKEQVEKTVKALTLETEQMRASLATEKNHAKSVEYDLNALVQAKNESEQNLTRIIDELKETARQQGTELASRADELDTGKTRIERLENQILDLTADKERAETELDTRTTAHVTEIQDLRTLLDETRATLGEKERETESLKAVVKETEEIRDKTGLDMMTLSDELSATRATLNEERERFRVAEERLTGEIRERDTALQDLHGEHQSAQSDLDEHRSTLSRVRSDLEAALATRGDIERGLDAATARVRDLESRLAATSEDSRERSRQIQALTGELEQVKTELETNRSTSRSTEESLAGEKQEREKVSHDLETALVAREDLERSLNESRATIQELEAELKTATSAGADTGKQASALASELEQVRAGLAEARSLSTSTGDALTREKQARDQVSRDLEEARATIQELEAGLKTATSAGAHTGKQASALADELEQVKAELETSRRQRREVGDQLAGQNQEKDRLEKLLEAAESESKLQESYKLTAIRKLSTELEASQSRLRDLEEQVAVLSREKQRAEETAESLADEIDQARTALADEWENHMDAKERLDTVVHEKQQVEGTAENLAAEIDQARTALADEWENHMDAKERLEAVVRQKQQMEASLHPPGELESEKAKKRSLIIKGPDIPMNAGIHPHSISAVQPAGVPAMVSPVPRITNIDDLFEDDEPDEEREELPSVSIIHEPVSDDEDTPVTDYLAGTASVEPVDAGMTRPDTGVTEPEEDDGVASTDMPEETDDDAVFEDDPAPAPGESTQSASWGLAINRAQWYDLLKWAHHSGTLTQDQRMQILRMGRLMQRGRKLTQKQEEQVRELLSLAQAQGYRLV